MGGILSKKTQEVHDEFKQDISHLNYDILRCCTQQKSESQRIKKQIKVMNSEKQQLDVKLLGLQRRINDLEDQVGLDINDS